MKFKSKKDLLFSSIVFGVIIFLIVVLAIGWYEGEIQSDEYGVLPVILITVGFLLWIYFGTHYELSPKNGLIYRCGPINGKIDVKRITEIVKGKTLWIGFRPATGRKGLIVKFDRFNEIYITPDSNEVFIKEILKLNDKIKITG